MKRLESIFADASIGAADIHQVIALCQLDFFTLFIANGREFEIGVVDHRENGVRSIADLSRCRQHCLDLRRPDMGALAIEIIKLVLVDSQTGSFLDVATKCLLRQSEDFGLNISGGGGGAYE